MYRSARLTLLELLLGPALIISEPVMGSTVATFMPVPLVAASLGLTMELLNGTGVINYIQKRTAQCNQRMGLNPQLDS